MTSFTPLQVGLHAPPAVSTSIVGMLASARLLPVLWSVSDPSPAAIMFWQMNDGLHWKVVVEAAACPAVLLLDGASSAEGPFPPTTRVMSQYSPLHLIRDALLDSVSKSRQANEFGLPRLTKREYDVLVLLEQGFTYHEIANRLVVTKETVRSHAASIRSKTGQSDRHSAVRFCRRAGLLPSRTTI